MKPTFRTHSEHIERLSFGKPLPKRYDWTNDPDKFKTLEGNIPHNRCFRCGSRFFNSDYAAFCEVCDLAMSPDNDEEAVCIITAQYEKNDKKIVEREFIPRRKMVACRIRIPEDKLTEEEHIENMKAAFQRANEIV